MSDRDTTEGWLLALIFGTVLGFGLHEIAGPEIERIQAEVIRRIENRPGPPLPCERSEGNE